MSPLSRSMQHYRDLGFTVEKTEHWNGFARRRVDLFGFADAICFKGNDIVLIQATSGPNVSARVEKINGIQAAKLWLESPNRRIVVHGWSKQGPRGKRKTWTLREVTITTLDNQKEGI